jgi:hypothetical protein
MDWFVAPDYWLTRWLIERGLALVYILAFGAVLHQFRALLGENGLTPVPAYLRGLRYRDAPSVFHVRYSDGLVVAMGVIGVAVGGLLLVGLPQAGPTWLPMLAWLLLWALYLSIVNVGQSFYAFGWESLLLEAGFLAIFLGNDAIAPPWLVILALRWLAFRVEFGAGLIKLRGDRCWRDLTCMDYHHETQPMPNPLSWYFHRLPRAFHRFEVVGNYAAQLVAPIGLFLPQPIAGLCAAFMIGTQLYLMASGNYAWLNLVTVIAAVAGLPDAFLRLFLPVGVPLLSEAPPWFVAAVVVLTGAIVALSYWPVRNLLGRGQLMNYSFNRYHLVNTYGAFGSVTRERYEVVVEGTLADQPGTDDWREYEFPGKPTDPRRRPPQVAPYHLRLDWLMWFAALSPAYAEPWLLPFLVKLLAGDRAIRGLLRHDPFGGRAPAAVRAVLYRYRYTTRAERRASGAWWSRTRVGDYVPAIRLRGGTDGGDGPGGQPELVRGA